MGQESQTFVSQSLIFTPLGLHMMVIHEHIFIYISNVHSFSYVLGGKYNPAFLTYKCIFKNKFKLKRQTEVGGGGGRELTRKGHFAVKEMFYVLRAGYLGNYKCQNLSNCAFCYV